VGGVTTDTLALVIAGGVGAVAGSAFTLVGTVVRAAVERRAQHEYDRRLASDQRRLAAYDEILTFVSHTRDRISRAILEDRPWDENAVETGQQARLETLMQIHGSEAVRAIAKEWRAAYDQALYTLSRWRWLGDPGNGEAAETASVRSKLEKDRARLQSVIDRLQEQIRREAHTVGSDTPHRRAPVARTLRVLGGLMIVTGLLLSTTRGWQGLWPKIRELASAQEHLLVPGLLIAGVMVVIIASLIGQHRPREGE
jgi:hypothetical protein